MMDRIGNGCIWGWGWVSMEEDCFITLHDNCSQHAHAGIDIDITYERNVQTPREVSPDRDHLMP